MMRIIMSRQMGKSQAHRMYQDYLRTVKEMTEYLCVVCKDKYAHKGKDRCEPVLIERLEPHVSDPFSQRHPLFSGSNGRAGTLHGVPVWVSDGVAPARTGSILEHEALEWTSSDTSANSMPQPDRIPDVEELREMITARDQWGLRDDHVRAETRRVLRERARSRRPQRFG